MLGKLSCAVALVLGMAVGAASAQPAETTRLVLGSARPNPQAGTLTIAGAGFGLLPFVTLDLVPLAVRSATDTEIVATAPVALMPPGDYVLTVSRGAGAGEHGSLDVALHGRAAAGGSSPATRSRRGAEAAAGDSNRRCGRAPPGRGGGRRRRDGR